MKKKLPSPADDVPHIERIVLYPVKSLDGVIVEKAFIGPTGGLQNDRRFSLVDESGKIVNGKREAKIHLVRSAYDFNAGTIELSAPGEPQLTARLFRDIESERLSAWFSRYFGRTVKIQEDAEAGFPDDTECPGPTFVAVSSLERVRSWMPASAEDLRTFSRRFRTNVEIGGAPAFWEDQLISASGARFFAGDVLFAGFRASARCVVPSRHALTAAVTPNFSKLFSDKRRRELPPWTDPALFDHTYRLCVNTRVPDPAPGASISVGDRVKLEFDFDISF